ncbi:SEC-C domain-containing protein [Pseudoalteromonas sp. MMG010]|uniref:YchJ family protein n=1 Tax=Pseudoalteromonas sp. MMG010 TaxID=2822685 RepID=UPI001B3A514A|nr:YchJ family metal-binding protein [Pseudoalteromonas sp. MMG010]MBQ4831633.1 SEC-C domain-containing protein [Pseudoalteromonas sp. MMG010]
MTQPSNSLCFCGTQHSFADCCEPIILNNRQAINAEQLMRSRYSAYVLENAQYIYETYASTVQSENPINEINDFATSCRFVELNVINAEETSDTTAMVEFKAFYFYENLFCQLHEKSQFIKEQSQWRYLTGEIIPVADKKIGRNDNCPCNSGKKYKKCHSQ